MTTRGIALALALSLVGCSVAQAVNVSTTIAITQKTPSKVIACLELIQLNLGQDPTNGQIQGGLDALANGTADYLSYTKPVDAGLCTVAGAALDYATATCALKNLAPDYVNIGAKYVVFTCRKLSGAEKPTPWNVLVRCP